MVSLALTATGWAVIGTISGALIGVTGGAIVEYGLDWLREHRLAKAGARLIAADISMAGSTLVGIQEDPEHRWFDYMEFSPQNWDEYRGVLATKLDGEDFEVVSQAVVVLRELFVKLPTVSTWPKAQGFMPLPEKSVETLAKTIKEATDAYNALADLAEHERVSATLHQDQATVASP